MPKKLKKFKMTAVMIEESEFSNRFVEDFLPSLGTLKSSGITIPPWLEPNFWDNCRHQDFARLIIVELFDYIISTVKRSNATKTNETPPEIESALLGISHIMLTFRVTFEKQSWTNYYNKIVMLPYPIVQYILVSLNKYTQSSEFNMKAVLNMITNKYDNLFTKQSMPLFNLILLLRTLHSDPSTARAFFVALKSRLESINTTSETIVLLHVIEIIVTIFPDLQKDFLLDLADQLKSVYILPLPASSKGFEIQKNVRKSIEYPGFLYYKLLRTIGSTNEATDAVIPFLFDANYQLLPTFLHSRQNPYFSIQKAFINYGNYYLVRKYNEKSRPAKEIIQILQNLDFDEKSEEKVIQEFNITKNPAPVEEFDVSTLAPPLIQLSQKKFSMTLFNILQTDTFVDGTECFMSPIPMRFISEIITPIARWAKTRPQNNIWDYKILVSSSASFMSHVLLGIIQGIFKFKEDISKMVLFIYLIQIDQTDYSPLSEYIGANDEIYSRFIHNVFSICSKIAPTLNSVSQTNFPLIVFEKQCSPNIWFSNPSPSAMIQNAIQDYLMFAQNMVSCYVWKAVLQFDQKSITVPFITSLHIGVQFSRGRFVDAEYSKKIKTKKVLISYDSVEVAPYEITSVALWNVDARLKIRPSDPTLIMEYINDTTNLDIDNFREQLKSQIKRIPVKQFYIAGNEKNPVYFNVFIDGITYEKIRTVTVFAMEFTEKKTHMTLNIPTFLPIE